MASPPPRKSPPKTKLLLIIELDYLIQSKQYGGLDKITSQVLKQSQYKYQQSNQQKYSQILTNTRPNKTLKLEHGTMLRRVFNGRTHQVEVVIDNDRQFSYYNSKHYNSLSKIAKLITDTHLSGPRFFGLTKTSQNKSKVKSSTN